jgi:hypothetical protein
VGGFAACGDDDDDGAADQTEDTVDESTDDTAADGEAAEGEEVDIEAYCEAIVDIETIPEPDVDFESMSEEQIQEEVATFATEEMLPITERIAANTPEEVESEVGVLIDTIEEIAETGDFAAFESPEVEEASETVHDFDLESCGWGEAAVEATDYAFEGIEDTYEAGVVSFDLTNGGEEMHEMGIFRKNDGVTESFDELLALDQEEAEAKATDVTFVEPTAPGDSDYSVVDLEPGEYMAVCFLPVGATPELFEAVESGEQAPPEGPPHFVQGMKVEFTVS